MSLKIAKSFRKPGVSWNPISDILLLKFDVHELKIGTKRELVSLMAKVYDPLVLLSPFTIQSKILA